MASLLSNEELQIYLILIGSHLEISERGMLSLKIQITETPCCQRTVEEKTFVLSHDCQGQTSARLSDQVEVWNAHLTLRSCWTPKLSLRVEEKFGCGKSVTLCRATRQGYPGFCSPWAGGVMPACGLRLARLHPPLAGCHLCSASLTATTAGLRMPPWARARHQSHRHQQGWSRGWTTRQTWSPRLQRRGLLGRQAWGGG